MILLKITAFWLLLIACFGLNCPAQYQLIPVDTIDIENGETESNKRFRAPKTWIQGKKIRVLDYYSWQVWDFDLEGNLGQTIKSGPPTKPLNDLWLYLFRRKSEGVAAQVFPVNDFKLQNNRIKGSETFYLFHPDGTFFRLQMQVKAPRPERKLDFRSYTAYDDFYPWQSPDSQSMVLPMLIWQKVKGYPHPSKENTFALAFCQLQKNRKRPKIIVNKFQKINFSGPIAPDLIGSLEVAWHLTLSEDRDQVFLSHHGTSQIKILNSKGEQTGEIPAKVLHLPQVQAIAPVYQKFSKKPGHFAKVREGMLLWYLESNVYGKMIHFPEAKFLLRQYRQGIQDTSTGNYSIEDHNFLLGEQIAVAPNWIQIFSLESPPRLITELPFPSHLKLLGMRNGMIYATLPFDRKEQKVKLIRFQLKTN